MQPARRSSASWREASRTTPCPACGHTSWCRQAEDGLVLCRRSSPPGSLARVDRNGVPFWVWRPGGLENGFSVFPPAVRALPPKPEAPRGSPAFLERVYRELLSLLPLLPHHREALRARSLADEAIRESAYRSMPGAERTRIAEDLHGQFGPALFSVPGFIVSTRGGNLPFASMAGAGPGLLIPCRAAGGRIQALKVRCDDPGPEGRRYFTLSSKRRGGPGPGSPAHVPIGTPARAELVRVTEGELKADVSWRLSGIPTVSVPGVDVWRSCAGPLMALGAKEVLAAFDMDWLQNPHVRRALLEMTGALRLSGLQVQIEIWDPINKGIDDLLRAGGSTEILKDEERGGQ